MDSEVLLGAAGIFALRVIGNMITTLRLIWIVRGQKMISAVAGAFEALVFAVAIGSVVSNLDNLWNMGAYCIGYAVGGYIAMVLEQRLVRRYVAVHIISPEHGHEVAEAIRAAGHGATELFGRGARGEVGSVTAVVGHLEVDDVVREVRRVDPNAFITLEELRAISQGYFRRFARPER